MIDTSNRWDDDPDYLKVVFALNLLEYQMVERLSRDWLVTVTGNKYAATLLAAWADGKPVPFQPDVVAHTAEYLGISADVLLSDHDRDDAEDGRRALAIQEAIKAAGGNNDQQAAAE